MRTSLLALILAAFAIDAAEAAFARAPQFGGVRLAQPHAPAAPVPLFKTRRLTADIASGRSSGCQAKMVAIPPSVSTAASTLTSLGAIVGADMLLRRAFLARAIPFPSSLAGMLGLFSGLCALQGAKPKAATAVFDFASPGCAFISRWLALFFVPNLVVLPLVLQMSATEAVKLATLVVVGLSVSLPLAAWTATAALGPAALKSSGGKAEWVGPAVEKPPPAAATPQKNLLLAPPLKGLAALSAGLAACALAAATVGSAVAPVAATSFLFSVTILGFAYGGSLPAAVQKALHPLILCTLATQAAAALLAAATSQPLIPLLRTYLIAGGAPLAAPGNLLLFMLGPATLSFGFQMFSRRRLMRESAKAVSAVVGSAAAFGLFVTALGGRWLRLDMGLRLAALPRQVTAPLAIAIAGMLSADPSVAATIVVVTGLLAANFGRAALDAVGCTSPVARGLAMGAAGHGLGTAAMAEEKEAFPFAAIAMALNAALSTVLVSVPVVRRLLLAAAGAPPA